MKINKRMIIIIALIATIAVIIHFMLNKKPKTDDPTTDTAEIGRAHV